MDTVDIPVFAARLIGGYWWLEAPCDDPLRREKIVLSLAEVLGTSRRFARHPADLPEPRACGHLSDRKNQRPRSIAAITLTAVAKS
jgi:hypothetical protein